MDPVVQRVAERPETFSRLLQAHQGNQRAKNLVGALEDQVDARVADRLLIGVLLGIADAAGDLERVVRRSKSQLRPEDLAGGRLEGEIDSASIHHVGAKKNGGVQ